MRFRPPPVYFMHLPRTGGTALGRWLRAAYGRRGYVDLKVETLPGVTTAHLRRVSCYHSWHLGRGMFDWLARPELASVTLLRQPIERAVSDLHGIQRTARDHGHRFTATSLAALQPWLYVAADDCIRSGVMDDLLANAQSRILGSACDLAAVRQATQPALRGPLNAVSWLDFPWLEGSGAAPDDAELHTRAVTWLDEMAVVGLTERYTESLLLIADLLGIPMPGKLPQANVNPQRIAPTIRYRDQLAPDAAARLEELNRFDLELYAHATERFEQQWARYQTQPKRTYSIAPRLRRMMSPLAKVGRRIGSPDRSPAIVPRYLQWFGLRQGLRIAWATWFAPAGEVSVQTGGARTPLYLRLRTSDFRIYGQVMARAEYALPLRCPPRVIIDAGANIGLTAVYFANRYPTARILAIEPEATNFNLLCKNTAAYPQILPIRAALWETPMVLSLVGQPGMYGAVRARLPGQSAPGHELGQVQALTMPQLLADYQIDFVDLLKMDIEGAEKGIFAASAAWIEQAGVIIAEMHDRFDPGCTLSFNAATRSFPLEWRTGEHIVVARREFVRDESVAGVRPPHESNTAASFDLIVHPPSGPPCAVPPTRWTGFRRRLKRIMGGE